MTAPALDLTFPADTGLGDLISGELDDLSPTAVHETETATAFVWRVFFATHDARDAAHRALERRFAADGLTFASLEVPDEDWAARSQADLRHVRIGRVIVSPPWDLPRNPSPEDVVVVIKPSMGFGTGHHATTRLCLRLLQRIDCGGKRVLDIGTGSGVLAIAAAKLGATDVVGLDIDADALASAEENLSPNFFTGGPGHTAPAPPAVHRAVPSHAVRFVLADVRDGPGTAADIVLANLTGAALTASAVDLIAWTKTGGQLVLSGFQPHETDAVMEAFSPSAIREALEIEDGWVAALIRKE